MNNGRKITNKESTKIKTLSKSLACAPEHRRINSSTLLQLERKTSNKTAFLKAVLLVYAVLCINC